MLEKDAILSKINIIKNCLFAIEHIKKDKHLQSNQDILDSLYTINIQRSCQACIDIANLLISVEGLELPTEYKQSFRILEKKRIIGAELSETMQKMVGFRNVAVHDYKKIDPVILQSIVDHHLKDFEDFYTVVFNYIKKW